MSKVTHLPVEKIKTEGMQTRVCLNRDVVKEYAEATTTGGATFPPIVVFRDELKNLWIGDGIHRLEAAKSTGQKTIAADLRDGSKGDALRFALKSNGTHGLRRTNADKAHAVKMAYESRMELGLPDVPAANLIAEIVGVSNHFVDAQLGTVPSWKNATARTGADGKTRELPPPPTRKPVVQAPSEHPQRKVDQKKEAPSQPPAPPTRKTVAVQEPDPEEAPAPRRKQEADGQVDELGKHIPVDLLPIWNRRQEVQDAATAISRVRVMLEKAQDGQDPLWSEINFSSVLNNLDRAFAEISASKPYVVCPMCQGIGCRACKNRGLMGEFRYEQCVPKEFKR